METNERYRTLGDPIGSEKRKLLEHFRAGVIKHRVINIPQGDISIYYTGPDIMSGVYAGYLFLLFGLSERYSDIGRVNIGEKEAQGLDYNGLHNKHVFVVSDIKDHLERERPYVVAREAKRKESKGWIPLSFTYIAATPFKPIDWEVIYLYKHFRTWTLQTPEERVIKIEDTGEYPPVFARSAMDDLRSMVATDERIVVTKGGVFAGIAATLALYDEGITPRLVYVKNGEDVWRKKDLIKNKKNIVIGSDRLLAEAIESNKEKLNIPEVLFINWHDYLPEEEQEDKH